MGKRAPGAVLAAQPHGCALEQKRAKGEKLGGGAKGEADEGDKEVSAGEDAADEAVEAAPEAIEPEEPADDPVEAAPEEESAPVAEPEPLQTVDVTIPEGLTISQIADVTKQAKLKGSYEKAVEKARKRFPLKRYGAERADSLEGFMFPATYELEKNAPAADLVDKQLVAFEDNFAGVDVKRAAKKNLTPYDIVTIASMIEKEVQVAEERPLVAAVIYNRLAAGDTLGIDATLRYELENYDQQLRQSELDAPTPYNSRINPGLPPTPIGNPGLAALEAAADPARSDVYYFVIKPGTCGEHVFTADSAEFEEAQAAYQEALAAEGGSPTDCPG